jgi:short-subunit dehydrogenase
MANEVVLITGASSGIGAALAREWAGRGARLALTARRRDKLDEVVAEVRERGGSAIAVECDVTRDGDVEKAVAAANAEWGRLDVAVANAGFGLSGLFESLSVDEYRRQFETNVFGLIRTVKAALPEILKSRGRIALVGSVAGYMATGGSSAYGMSKYAVRGLAQALRGELFPRGVSVTHIAPGFVESEFRLKDAHGQMRQSASDPVPSWLLVPSRVAARAIVRAVMARRREAIITGHGKILVLIARHFPGTLDFMIRHLPAWRERDLAQRA